MKNWIEQQRETFNSLNYYNREHPEYLEARKNLGLVDNIKLASGKEIKGYDEYFYGGLLIENQSDTDDNFEFTVILFSIDEIDVLYKVN